MSMATTSVPLAAISRAMARPMPLAAPVTLPWSIEPCPALMGPALRSADGSGICFPSFVRSHSCGGRTDHRESGALLDRLEAAILTKAFKGELVPQNPNDEPASVLLERIRAQRMAAVPAARAKRGRRAQ